MFYIIAVLYCLPATLVLAGEAKTQNTCTGCLTTLNLKSQQMAKITAKTILKASDYNYKKDISTKHKFPDIKAKYRMVY